MQFLFQSLQFHYNMVKDLLNRKIHVFAEKPLCLEPAQSSDLVKLAADNKCINQVGYHNKFVGTFREVKKIVQGGFLGDIYHFRGSLRTGCCKEKTRYLAFRPFRRRSLMGYASHVIDLINDILAPVESSRGSILKPVYSNNVEDAVYSLLELKNKVTGVLSVNWSDDTYRKMSTSITVIGTRGKIISDANELKVFFDKDPKLPAGYSKGWNVKYVTELTEQVDFFFRGEEIFCAD